jgi:hypothetical protein
VARERLRLTAPANCRCWQRLNRPQDPSPDVAGEAFSRQPRGAAAATSPTPRGPAGAQRREPHRDDPRAVRRGRVGAGSGRPARGSSSGASSDGAHLDHDRATRGRSGTTPILVPLSAYIDAHPGTSDPVRIDRDRPPGLSFRASGRSAVPLHTREVAGSKPAAPIIPSAPARCVCLSPNPATRRPTYGSTPRRQAPWATADAVPLSNAYGRLHIPSMFRNEGQPLPG